jgi:AcrR family transcriptional regulator
MSNAAQRQRRLQYRADTRRAILDAAEELLVEGGPDAFSMRRLAERCGCTAPTLYHYFRDKPGLIVALLEERLQGLVRELRAVKPSRDPVQTVRALGAAFARFGLRNPGHYQLLVAPRGEETPEPPSTQEVQRLFLDPLEELVRRGDLAPGALERLRQGLWCLVHGFVLLQTTHADHPWEPGLLDAALDAMIRGSLRADPARAGPPPTAAPQAQKRSRK